MIRKAATTDIPAIQRIARQFPKQVGFVRRGALERGIDKSELYVADVGGVVGFISWHERRDGWHTVYELAVDKAHQRSGIGRALLYAVPCPIRLKCPVDNASNRFYANAGMNWARTEQGKKRSLNVYELRVLNIVIRGNNPNVPLICRITASAYGVQEHHKAHAWPFMVDVDFVAPDWSAYMATIRDKQPVQACVVDYMHPDKKAEMLSQVVELKAASVLRVVVPVKFHGAVVDVPLDCIVGVSLRTDGRLATSANKYAGFMPDFAELRGRKVHLLGGSPNLQSDTISKLNGIGATVISCDGSAQFGGGALGSTYIQGRWRRKDGERVDPLASALTSTLNIRKELNHAAQVAQLPLFKSQ